MLLDFRRTGKNQASTKCLKGNTGSAVERRIRQRDKETRDEVKGRRKKTLTGKPISVSM